MRSTSTSPATSVRNGTPCSKSQMLSSRPAQQGSSPRRQAHYTPHPSLARTKPAGGPRRPAAELLARPPPSSRVNVEVEQKPSRPLQRGGDLLDRHVFGQRGRNQTSSLVVENERRSIRRVLDDTQIDSGGSSTRRFHRPGVATSNAAPVARARARAGSRAGRRAGLRRAVDLAVCSAGVVVAGFHDSRMTFVSPPAAVRPTTPSRRVAVGERPHVREHQGAASPEIRPRIVALQCATWPKYTSLKKSQSSRLPTPRP